MLSWVAIKLTTRCAMAGLADFLTTTTHVQLKLCTCNDYDVMFDRK